jgi:hypothetical protein
MPMTLAEKLDEIRAAGAKRRKPEELAVMAAVTRAQREAGLADKALKVGDELPDFALVNAQGVEIHSADLLAQGPLVLTVFRGVW